MLDAFYGRLYLTINKAIYPNFKAGHNVAFNGVPFLRPLGNTVIGDNCTFNSTANFNAVGMFKNCSIFVWKEATLTIGNNSGFSGVSIFAEVGITIGNYCNFGGNVCIWDTDFHSLDYMERRQVFEQNRISKPITIGDDVFVGANSIILKGVTIGNRAIIGAGSVVTKNVGDDEIWAGNPAKFIRPVIKQ
jgi:acetyltransferase-like isoleucine patch superfamily enzyme